MLSSTVNQKRGDQIAGEKMNSRFLGIPAEDWCSVHLPTRYAEAINMYAPSFGGGRGTFVDSAVVLKGMAIFAESLSL